MLFDRIALARDLTDCRGETLAPRGFVISPEAIAEVAARAPRGHPRTPLAETPLARELGELLDEPRYAHLFRRGRAAEAVERAVASVRLPSALWDELAFAGELAPALRRHALVTAAVAARMLLAAVGEARAIPELAAAALLHDLGMRHVPGHLHGAAGPLAAEEAAAIAAHPLLGAFHVALALGRHPAVDAAWLHHWRSGQGYPRAGAAPTRSVEVVAVASAFAALTQPRPFRGVAWDARGAADLLVEEARARRADPITVRLLVHALRGGEGDPRALRPARRRHEQPPGEREYVHLAPPAAAMIEARPTGADQAAASRPQADRSVPQA